MKIGFLDRSITAAAAMMAALARDTGYFDNSPAPAVKEPEPRRGRRFKPRNGAVTLGYGKPDKRTRRFKWGQYGEIPAWARKDARR